MAADKVQEWKNLADWRKYVEQQAQRVDEDAAPGTSAEEETSPAAPLAPPAVDEPLLSHDAAQNLVEEKKSDGSAASRRKGKQRKPPISKEELLRRLTDPLITLQEAAIILEVCTATVRRYTDAELLNCYRTDGNQRRFRLSEVLALEERLRHTTRRGPKSGKARVSSNRPNRQTTVGAVSPTPHRMVLPLRVSPKNS